MSFLTEFQRSLLGPVLVELKAQEQREEEQANKRHKEMKEDLTRITAAVQGISDRVDQALVIVTDERDLIQKLKDEIAAQDSDVTPELTVLATKLEEKNAQAAAVLNPPPPPPG